MATEPVPQRGRLRWLWWLVAYTCLGLGIVGVVIPVLPTVPFILAATYAAARGSERLHTWLVTHPRFGPIIVTWQTQRAIPRYAKRLAIGSMVFCAVIIVVFAPLLWVKIFSCAFMACVGTWIWLRPEPVPEETAVPLDQADRGSEPPR